MLNHIVIDATNCGSFFGPLASRYVANWELRKRIDELYEAAQRSRNRYFVLEGRTCRAAQSTRKGAERYMTPETVLVEINLPLGEKGTTRNGNENEQGR